MLIDLQGQGGGGNNLSGNNQLPLGFIDFPQPPALPVMPQAPFNYPSPGTSSTHTASAPASAPFSYNIPPYPPLDQEKKDLNTQFQQVRLHNRLQFNICMCYNVWSFVSQLL